MTNLLRAAIIFSAVTRANSEKLLCPFGGPVYWGYLKVQQDGASGLSVSVEFQSAQKPSPDTNLFLKIHDVPHFYGDSASNCTSRTASSVVLRSSLPGRIEKRTLSSLLGHGFSIDVGVHCLSGTLVMQNNEADVREAAFRNSQAVYGIVYVLQLDQVKGIKLISRLKMRETATTSERYVEPIRWGWDEVWWRHGEHFRCRDRQGIVQPQSSASSSFYVGKTTMRTLHSAALDIRDAVLFLFDGSGKILDCAPIVPTTKRSALSLLGQSELNFVQNSPIQPVVASVIGSSNSKQPWYTVDRPMANCELVTKWNLPKKIVPLVETVNGTFLPSLTLFGAETMQMKSLIQAGNCGLIRGLNSEKVAQARFYHRIAGSVNFLQLSEGVTVIWASLRHLFDTKDSAVDWQILSGGPVGVEGISDLACAKVHGKQILYDLGQKLGRKLVISAQNRSLVPVQRFVLESGEDFWGQSVGKTLQINFGWAKSCSTLEKSVGFETLEARLFSHGIGSETAIGKLIFSSWDDAGSSLSLLLNKHSSTGRADHKKRSSTVYKLALHSYPIEQSAAGHPCSWPSVGPLYEEGNRRLLNGVVTDFSTVDIGGFQPKTSHLPFGQTPKRTGVMGKTAVLSRENAGPFACGTFWPKIDESRVVRVVAEFDEPWVKGRIFMTQFVPKKDELGLHPLTLVDSRLESAVSNRPQSLNWVVEHSSVCSNGRGRTLIPYNPFGLETKNTRYKTGCLMNAKLCALGDLSAKFRGPLTIGRQVFAMEMLPLTGPFSVSNMTMWLADEGKEIRKACSNITEIVERHLSILVPINTSRGMVISQISEALNLEDWQLIVAYSRTLFGNKCFRFDVTIRDSQSNMTKLKQPLEKETEKLFPKPDCDEKQSVASDSPAMHIQGRIVAVLLQSIFTIVIESYCC